MVREVVWTKRATNKFNKILEYLEKEWGERVTRSFVRKAYSIFELLTDHPEIGTLENLSKNIRGFPLTKHNRLFYRVTDTQIVLLTFFDSRMNPKKKKL